MTYIEKGTEWESRLERDCSIACGMYIDMFEAYEGTGTAPMPLDACIAAQVAMENLDEAVEAIKSDLRFHLLITRGRIIEP